MIEDIKRKLEENEKQYIWRLASAKSNGILDMSWQELTDIFNKEFCDEDKGFNESTYRKPFQYAEEYYKDVFSKMISDDYSKELLAQKDELYKIKKQVFDQRREYNKLLVSDARAEHLTEQLIQIAKQLNNEKPLEFNKCIIDYSDKEGIVCFCDWHYGMTTDNIWNKYDINICKSRIEQYVCKTKQYIKLHGIKKLHILLFGDLAHGAIHTGCRVASEEDTCDQLMHVAELAAEAINELSNVVNETNVYSTYGNHLRTIQNKNDNIHSDNMEKIIPWWLKQRFENRNDVNIIYAEYKEFIKFNVLGYNICVVHGDLDKFKDLGVTVNTLFTKLFHEDINYTISGDKHHLEEFEQFDIESILVRSLCGTDEFANVHRLYSKAGQTFMVFSKDEGRECTYNIKLN